MTSRNMSWTGSAGDGSYSNANDWNDETDSEDPAASPPTGSDFVTFSLSSGGTVAFGGGAAETLDVSGTGTWNFSGALTIGGEPDSPYTPYAFEIAASVTFSAVDLTAQGSGGIDGALIVEGGSTVTTQDDGIGETPGATGSLTLTGAGTTWHVESDPAANQNGYITGYLTIGNGAATGTQAGGNGKLTVTAGAALLVDIGASIGNAAGSTGTATVSNDGTWTISGADGLTVGAAGAGTVTVTGTGSLLDLGTNPLQIGTGAGGTGSLTVSAGAAAHAGSANSATGADALSVGRAGGTGTLTVNAGTLTVYGYADVGLGGSGSIVVEDSGDLTFAADQSDTAGLSIGKGFNASTSVGIGGTGAVTVTSGGMLTSAQNISIGGNGDDGTLTVTDQGKVAIGTQLVVGYAASISGVTYDGNGSVAIGAGGTLLITAAPEYANAAIAIGTTTAASLVDPGATGAITVSGTGALLNTGGSPIAIGQRGTGSLTVSDNGTVVTGSPNSASFAALGVGLQGVGSVTITGSASTLTSDGFVYLGRAGTGNLTVENYGTLAIYNGTDGTGSGSLSVGGANATAATSLYVDGTGTALVTAHGRVTAATSLYVGSTGATGLLTIDNGGSVEATDQVAIGNTATLAAGGTLITAAGATTVASATAYAGTGTVDVGAGGTLKADGALSNGYAAIVVGNGPGATGMLNVSGPGALVNAGGYRITIGNYGAGTMLVGNGGTAEAGAAYTDTEPAVYIGNTVAATGALTVTGAGSTFTAAGQMDVGNAGTGALTIDDAGTVSATALDTGVASGGTGIITITGGGSDLTVTNQFTVGDTGSAELSILNGATATVGDMDIGLNAGGTGTVDLEGNNTLLHVTGDLHIGDAGSAVITLGAGTELTVDGDFFTGTKGRIVGLGGTIDPAHYYNTTTTTGPLTVVASVAIVNTGTFIAEGGLLELNGPVTDTGVLQIQDGGILQLDHSVAASQTVTFTSVGGTLDIKDPNDFAPTIGGYATGDTVQVYGISGQPAPTFSYSGGDTIVTYGNGVALTFAGTYSDGGIDIAADTTPAPCFLIGTRIATDRGEVAVEDLRVGDSVLTEAGGLRPITWIGRRAIDPARHPNPSYVLPVRVREDAFGFGAPHRDLYLSPDHAIFVRDVLIPVKYLVNGRGVSQLPEFGAITYFHVELDRHDVLLAEGLPTESYLETGNRAAFANGGAPAVPHPDFGERVWEAKGCAPLVVTGRRLEAARRLLLAEEAIANWRGQAYARGEMAPPHCWHSGAA